MKLSVLTVVLLVLVVDLLEEVPEALLVTGSGSSGSCRAGAADCSCHKPTEFKSIKVQ